MLTPVGGCFAQGMPPLMKQAYTCALTNRAFSAAASSALRCDSLEVRLGAVAAAAGAVAAAAGAVAAASSSLDMYLARAARRHVVDPLCYSLSPYCRRLAGESSAP